MLRRAGWDSIIFIIFSKFMIWVRRTTSNHHTKRWSILSHRCINTLSASNSTPIWKVWLLMTSNNFFWPESARLSAFERPLREFPKNFPRFSRKKLWAVCQIHRLKYATKWGSHYRLVQHPIVLHTDTKNDSLHPVKKSHLFWCHVDPLFRCPRSKNGINWEPDTHKWVSRHLPIRSQVSFDSPDSSNDLENTSFMGVMTLSYGCQVLIWSHFGA